MAFSPTLAPRSGVSIVFLAADIFGYVCWNVDDTGIGQQLEHLIGQGDATLFRRAFGWRTALPAPSVPLQLEEHLAATPRDEQERGMAWAKAPQFLSRVGGGGDGALVDPSYEIALLKTRVLGGAVVLRAFYDRAEKGSSRCGAMTRCVGERETQRVRFVRRSRLTGWRYRQVSTSIDSVRISPL